MTEPKFPFLEPRDYQVKAYESWVANGYQGIFAMATGTGKTITSLNCVLELWRNSKQKVYRAIILVPTLTLMDQWEKEALAFNFEEIIKVSAKSSWTKKISELLSYAKKIGGASFIAIVTYSSFIKEKFQSFFRRLPEDTILIADEGHNFASREISNLYSNIHLQKRICLSATPQRHHDDEGTKRLEEFFNDSPPYIYSFSMERAIEEGILCKYYYFPHLVKLTTAEFEAYQKISKKIAQQYHINKEESQDSASMEFLLLQRKRIVQRAENKLPLTIKILKEQFEKNRNLKYTFVYVPEGFTEQEDELAEGKEGLRIINQYTRGIANIDNGILIDQFVGHMRDKKTVLRHFREGRIHVLASMKCLDEGVDIPRAEFAIFCSSTGNPRQFIQRRGRVLRKHKDKHLATIHDLVVVPDFSTSDLDAKGKKIQRGLVKKELERVIYFASLALNPFETDHVFADVCEYYNLNLYTIKKEIKDHD